MASPDVVISESRALLARCLSEIDALHTKAGPRGELAKLEWRERLRAARTGRDHARRLLKKYGAEHYEWTAAEQRKERAVRLRESGLIFRDVGAALGVSPVRAQQLVREGLRMRVLRKKWGRA